MKTYIYLFYENYPIGNKGVINVKIGFASHNKTDEAIKNRKTYLASSYPVTITRRIIQLQTGNPRKIEPIAYFEYQDEKSVRIMERNLHSYFTNKKSEHSSEWFNLLYEDISKILSLFIGSTDNDLLKIVKPYDLWIGDKWNKI